MQRTQQVHVHLAAALALAVAAWGCGSNGGPDGDVGRDGGVEDAGAENASDGGLDGGADASDDGGLGDAGEDAGPSDGGGDAGDGGDLDGGIDGGLDGGDSDGGADGGEDGGLDGGEDGGVTVGPKGTGPVYPADRDHSPITPEVAASLQQVVDPALGRDPRVFAKVGDSISTGERFMYCFTDPAAVDLDGRVELEPGIDWFRAGDAAGTTPYDRASLATTVGWSARDVLEDTPSPLEQEVAALSPGFASVMFGTNDVGWQFAEDYAQEMWEIVDGLLDSGVIPVLSTIPPRESGEYPIVRVPFFNAIVRALAQGRRIPLVDYHRTMLQLPDQGLGSDGVHPSANGAIGFCDFTADGLEYGYNARNLLTIQALDRLRRAVVEEEAAPDAVGEPILGEGTQADPIEAPGLPFGNLRDLDTQGTTTSLGSLAACTSSPGGGPGLVYRVDLAEGRDVQAAAYAAPGTGADLEVYVLDAARGTCWAAPGVDTCTYPDNQDDQCVRRWLPAGSYDLVVVGASAADAAEVLVVVF